MGEAAGDVRWGAARLGTTVVTGRPDQGSLTSAIGSMNHVAFDVAPEKIEEYRDRLIAAGVPCTEVANHDDSEWGISDNNRKAKFYRLTAKGRKELNAATGRWRRMTRAIDLILGPSTE